MKKNERGKREMSSFNLVTSVVEVASSIKRWWQYDCFGDKVLSDKLKKSDQWKDYESSEEDLFFTDDEETDCAGTKNYKSDGGSISSSTSNDNDQWIEDSLEIYDDEELKDSLKEVVMLAPEPSKSDSNAHRK